MSLIVLQSSDFLAQKHSFVSFTYLLFKTVGFDCLLPLGAILKGWIKQNNLHFL
jgi:hypothetical protein